MSGEPLSQETHAGTRPARSHLPAGSSGQSPSVGLLIVHGIGEQKPGDTVERFVRSIRRGVRDVTVDTRGNGVLDIDGRTIRLYEVYWADLLNGEIARNTFDFDVALALPWFPGLNRLRGLYAPGGYPRWVSALRTLELVMLVAAAVIIYWTVTLFWLGTRRMLPNLRRILRGRRPDWTFQLVRPEEKNFFRAILQTLRGRGVKRDAASWGSADFLVDNFAGDVLTYVGSCRRALPESSPVRGRADEIIDRFHAALRAACDDGCSEIQIVAHSLGTVIAYHGITGYNLPLADDAGPFQDGATYDPLSRVTRLYTIGSPLEKIRFLWPQLISKEALGSVRYGDGRPHRLRRPGSQPQRPSFQWDNFRGRYDLVSGKLKHFDHWGPVKNHRVRRGGFLRSHSIYQRSPEFLRILIEGLTNKRARLTRPLARLLRRLVNPIASFFENWWLAGPGTVIVVLVGVLVCGGFASYLLVAPLMLLGHQRAAELTFYVALAVTGAMVILGVIVRGRSFAPSVHARYTSVSDDGHHGTETSLSVEEDAI
jgi:hypothetical protein